MEAATYKQLAHTHLEETQRQALLLLLCWVLIVEHMELFIIINGV
jgi:hypothetical protein